MNLINQINEKFQQAGLPFMALDRDNSIFIKRNSYYTKTNIHNIEQLECPLQLMSVFTDYYPQLIDDCRRFNENEIETISLLNGNSGHQLSIKIKDSVEISNQVEHNQNLEFENDRIYHNVPIGLVYTKKVITNQYDAPQQLKDCLSLTNPKLDIQKNEINKLVSDFNHRLDAPVQNQNVTESQFSYPTYDGPINVDNLNEWVTTQGLPFKYVEESITNNVKGMALHHNNGNVLYFYTSSNGQYTVDVVSDLNFFNQLYHIDTKYINESFDINEDGIITRLGSHEVAKIEHKGNGIVMATVYTDIDISKSNYTGTNFENVRVWIDPSSTIMTNLDNFKEDMELVYQASKDLSRNLNDYGLKIADNLLINNLTLDDLKTIDRTIQL